MYVLFNQRGGDNAKNNIKGVTNMENNTCDLKNNKIENGSWKWIPVPGCLFCVLVIYKKARRGRCLVLLVQIITIATIPLITNIFTSLHISTHLYYHKKTCLLTLLTTTRVLRPLRPPLSGARSWQSLPHPKPHLWDVL